jgi:hypothetical protein
MPPVGLEGGEEPVVGVPSAGRDLGVHRWEYSRTLVGDPAAGQRRDLVDEPVPLLGAGVGQDRTVKDHRVASLGALAASVAGPSLWLPDTSRGIVLSDVDGRVKPLTALGLL